MTLHLPIKKTWFDLILCGAKKEEYRDLTQYYFKRLTGSPFPIKEDNLTYTVPAPQSYVAELIPQSQNTTPFIFKPYTILHLRNGYSPRSPQLYIEIKSITICKGKEDWGARPGQLYFIIHLGAITKPLYLK